MSCHISNTHIIYIYTVYTYWYVHTHENYHEVYQLGMTHKLWQSMAVTPCLGTAGAWMWCTTTGVALAEAYRHGRGSWVAGGGSKENRSCSWKWPLWNNEIIKNYYGQYKSFIGSYGHYWNTHIHTQSHALVVHSYFFTCFLPIWLKWRRVSSCYLWSLPEMVGTCCRTCLQLSWEKPMVSNRFSSYKMPQY